MSLVLVLPLLPVSPTTCRGSSCPRHQVARLCSAASVSSTCTTVQPGAKSPSTRDTTTAAAPFCEASAAKVLPSKRSPQSARNTQPGVMARLSVVRPAVMARSPGTTALPAVAVMRSLVLRWVMAVVGGVTCCCGGLPACGRARRCPPGSSRRSTCAPRQNRRNRWFRWRKSGNSRAPCRR